MTGFQRAGRRRFHNMTRERLQPALIMIAMVPILLVCPFVLRYFTTGLTLGLVKE